MKIEPQKKPIWSAAPTVRIRGKQDGEVVFEVDGPIASADREAKRYAAQYAEDGPVSLERHNGKRWIKYVRYQIGLAACSPEKAREIQAKGGKASPVRPLKDAKRASVIGKKGNDVRWKKPLD